MLSPTKKLSDEQKLEIVKTYTTESTNCAAIARKYKVTTAAINGLLRRRGVLIRNNKSALCRKYSLDETFFNYIDTEAKAYFLGLLYADGSNYEKTGSIRLSLQESDRAILDELNQNLKSNRPLYYVNYKKHGARHNHYALSITNQYLSKQLAKIGCFSKKSLTLQWPQEDLIPRDLIRHFVRGYFDGDGTFTHGHPPTSKKNTLQASFISTHHFCEHFNLLALEIFGWQGGIYRRKVSGSKNTFIWQINNKRRVLFFLDWLYKDSKFFLKRKYDKYLKIKQEFNA